MDSLDSKKVIFLDRDGVINEEVNYLRRINEFRFIDGVFDACLQFLDCGYQIIIITNQSGISKGYLNERKFMQITKWMTDQFRKKNIKILDIFYCPHNPEDNCACRKPNPGMFLQAKKKHNIDMAHSWAIGDKETDIVAANNSGISKTILVKSGHKFDYKNHYDLLC